jgi:hypothetical protein
MQMHNEWINQITVQLNHKKKLSLLLGFLHSSCWRYALCRGLSKGMYESNEKESVKRLLSNQ